MCVGLSAKVVKISNGTAVVDAGGAKREVSSKLLENLEPGDYVMVHAGVAIARSPMKMKARPISLWRNCCNGRTKETNSQRDHRKL